MLAGYGLRAYVLDCQKSQEPSYQCRYIEIPYLDTTDQMDIDSSGGRWNIVLKNGYILRPSNVYQDTSWTNGMYINFDMYALTSQDIDTMFYSLEDTFPDWEGMPK